MTGSIRENADKASASRITSLISGGNLEGLKEFFAWQPDCLYRSDRGCSWLYTAVSCSRTEIVAWLLEKGCAADEGAPDRSTPLMCAMHAATPEGAEIARLLVAAGADVQKADFRPWRAIHYACDKNNLEGLKILVEAGADLNVADLLGRTPLSRAIITGWPEGVAFLLAHGADRKTGPDGLSAQETARRLAHRSSAHQKTLEIIVEHERRFRAAMTSGTSRPVPRLQAPRLPRKG